MANKQTAVEWLFKWMTINKDSIIEERLLAFEQAKQMEKEQIFNSYEAGFKDEYFEPNEYYNETYKNKEK